MTVQATMLWIQRCSSRCAVLSRGATLALLLAMVSGRIDAQSVKEPRVVRGVIQTADMRPAGGSNVFILETLEGMVTGDDGRFSIAVSATGTVTLVVRRLGHAEQRRKIVDALATALAITLPAQTVSLAPIRVQAGQYTAGGERGATLTTLEVVTTPGTAAEVNRAIQSLPGVQSGDEGNALFVRGGDFTETRVFLNDAALLTPVQLQTPTGTFTGGVDPFLLDGIFFSSGGFGARYGDALSGVVALQTQRRPARNTATATAGLSSLSASGAVKASRILSFRATARRTDLGPMFRLNRTLRYDPAPHGHDLSASAIVNYRPSGEITLFGIRQSNALGLGVEEASFNGTMSAAARSAQGVLTWRDSFGTLVPTLTGALSHDRSALDLGAFRLASDALHAQLFGRLEWRPGSRLVPRVGGEIDRLTSAYDGTLPSVGYDVRPGARTTVVESSRTGLRAGAFAEIDWLPHPDTRIVLGTRTDRSSLTGARTVDPRVSVAWKAGFGLTMTAAWGRYHQVPDPLYFNDSLSAAPGALRSMRAEQRVVGLQVGADEQVVRVEGYQKQYAALAQRTRDYAVVGGGKGRARGVDVFAKGRVGLGFTGRVSYSLVSSRRTDPDAGVMARAPFDVTHSTTAIVERTLRGGLRGAIAFRQGTGRPFTPVQGAEFDAASAVYVPSYAAPMSERLPPFRRIDISASWFRVVRPGLQAVLFVSLMNTSDHANAQRYRYNVDYSRRHLVPSLFQRSVYFGGSLTWLKGD